MNQERKDALIEGGRQYGLALAGAGKVSASVANADVNVAVFAVEQLKGKYEKANGKEPKLTSGKPAGASVDTFMSWAEVTAAMFDPRYATDHGYRKRIERKLSRSNTS